MDEMRELCLRIFGTDRPEELQTIASKAERYDRMFRQEYPVNSRNAGRKMKFAQDGQDAMIRMYQDGTPVKEIARRFDTTRQTVYKYIKAAKRVRENPYVTMRMNYKYKDQLCTTIDVDFYHKKIYVENHTSDIIHRAFGVVQNPDWERFEEFLESRCFPQSRAELKNVLRDIGLDSYDPLQIIEKTGGRMAEDKQWIEIVDFRGQDCCGGVNNPAAVLPAGINHGNGWEK